ncbi:MAG TPA: HD-GYP domain-containing protein [Gaiellaceae bacterium]|nr:HD-GYP domain-containing protein [Gaiellaceae bacterium]
MRREPLLPALGFTGVAALVPALALERVGERQVSLSGEVHFVSVGVSALAALAAGIALGIVGVRRGDARAALVGAAFSVMAGLLAVHGLASPGVLIGMNGVVAFSGAATLPAGAAVLALGAAPWLRGREGVRRLLVLQVTLVVAVVALGLVGMLVPSFVPAVPETGSGPAVALLLGGLALFGLLVVRAARTFALARRGRDLLVVAGLGWLAASLAGALLLRYDQLGWWLGHGYELVGILLVGAPVAVDLLRDAPTRPLLGDLRGAELVAQEEAFLGAHVRDLTRRLAEKDRSTEDHTRRVALLAVRVGEELGLPPHRLRQLAIGGLLHDIGKLAVPDEILKKPGPLDEDEFREIQRHPVQGERLLGELGFGDKVRRLVLDHHERLDGKGYPRGLGQRTIDLDTKILTVCDVYDALISPRVYRDAFSADEALRLIRSQAGTAFDVRCVGALERVLGRERAQVPLAVAAATLGA